MEDLSQFHQNDFIVIKLSYNNLVNVGVVADRHWFAYSIFLGHQSCQFLFPLMIHLYDSIGAASTD
ncbi:hypothetical protein DPMN_099585 [Dreissena polymorpha]|uniref:Uncharacterized protein n=1 Tax=Dreissena polymorpha TaxID=45954 RepID=A0A9D4LED8_DREPO|nr:hypothetical protein DPMN_099585 [Dreissena polymorpha]